jgi:hypothetical protein
VLFAETGGDALYTDARIDRTPPAAGMRATLQSGMVA